MINYFNEEIQLPKLKRRIYSKWIKSIIIEYGFTLGEINYIFCSDKYLLQINKQYLNHDYFTDIITFNYNIEKFVSSDIYISIETVAKNADYYNVTFDNELNRVMIHGILHLLGFDDKTEDEKIVMKEKEDEALDLLSLLNK